MIPTTITICNKDPPAHAHCHRVGYTTSSNQKLKSSTRSRPAVPRTLERRKLHPDQATRVDPPGFDPKTGLTPATIRHSRTRCRTFDSSTEPGHTRPSSARPRPRRQQQEPPSTKNIQHQQEQQLRRNKIKQQAHRKDKHDGPRSTRATTPNHRLRRGRRKKVHSGAPQRKPLEPEEGGVAKMRQRRGEKGNHNERPSLLTKRPLPQRKSRQESLSPVSLEDDSRGRSERELSNTSRNEGIGCRSSTSKDHDVNGGNNISKATDCNGVPRTLSIPKPSSGTITTTTSSLPEETTNESEHRHSHLAPAKFRTDTGRNKRALPFHSVTSEEKREMLGENADANEDKDAAKSQDRAGSYRDLLTMMDRRQNECASPVQSDYMGGCRNGGNDAEFATESHISMPGQTIRDRKSSSSRTGGSMTLGESSGIESGNSIDESLSDGTFDSLCTKSPTQPKPIYSVDAPANFPAFVKANPLPLSVDNDLKNADRNLSKKHLKKKHPGIEYISDQLNQIKDMREKIHNRVGNGAVGVTSLHLGDLTQERLEHCQQLLDTSGDQNNHGSAYFQTRMMDSLHLSDLELNEDDGEGNRVRMR